MMLLGGGGGWVWFWGRTDLKEEYAKWSLSSFSPGAFLAVRGMMAATAARPTSAGLLSAVRWRGQAGAGGSC